MHVRNCGAKFVIIGTHALEIPGITFPKFVAFDAVSKCSLYGKLHNMNYLSQYFDILIFHNNTQFRNVTTPETFFEIHSAFCLLDPLWY
jgi:hypothetical protein